MARNFPESWVLAMMPLDLVLDLVVPLILVLSIGVAFLSIRFFSLNTKVINGGFQKFIVGFVVAYIFIVLGVHLFDMFLTWRMSSFDLDGNGIFTNSEGNESLYIYQKAVSEDLGRNLAPVTSLAIAPFASIFALLLGRLLERRGNKAKPGKVHSMHRF